MKNQDKTKKKKSKKPLLLIVIASIIPNLYLMHLCSKYDMATLEDRDVIVNYEVAGDKYYALTLKPGKQAYIFIDPVMDGDSPIKINVLLNASEFGFIKNLTLRLMSEESDDTTYYHYDNSEIMFENYYKDSRTYTILIEPQSSKPYSLDIIHYSEMLDARPVSLGIMLIYLGILLPVAMVVLNEEDIKFRDHATHFKGILLISLTNFILWLLYYINISILYEALVIG